jgi:hypothetical protein
LALLDRLYWRTNFAVLSSYDQAVALQLGCAGGPYEKGNICATLEEFPAEVSPQRARA